MPINENNPSHQEPLSETPEESVSPKPPVGFKDSPAVVQQYITATGLENKFGDSTERWVQAVEYTKAGRNVELLARLVSRQERRPVLAINNARVGAFLQFGFSHWLENFSDEPQAEEFVTTLETEDDYQSTKLALMRSIEELRDFLATSAAVLHLAAETNTAYDVLTNSHDPSADLRLEIMSSSITSHAGKEKIYDGLGLATPSRPKISPYSDWASPQVQALLSTRTQFETDLDGILEKITELKDRMRAMIFQLASDWLKIGRIQSFVYPINHFKLSGNGPVDEEIDVTAQRKLYQTVSMKDTLVLFSDVHKAFPYDFHTLTGFYNNWSQRTVTTSPFMKLLAESKILIADLPFPFSQNTKNGRVGVQLYKPILEHIQHLSGSLKFVDLSAAFPSQRGSQSLTHTIGGSNENWAYDPGYVMSLTSVPKGTFKSLTQYGKSQPWVGKYLTRIPIEANYTPAGPEYTLYERE